MFVRVLKRSGQLVFVDSVQPDQDSEAFVMRGEEIDVRACAYQQSRVFVDERQVYGTVHATRVNEGAVPNCKRRLAPGHALLRIRQTKRDTSDIVPVHNSRTLPPAN